LPFYYYFKKLGWIVGFIRAYMDKRIFPKKDAESDVT